MRTRRGTLGLAMCLVVGLGTSVGSAATRPVVTADVVQLVSLTPDGATAVALTADFNGNPRLVSVPEAPGLPVVHAALGGGRLSDFEVFDDLVIFLLIDDDTTELWSADLDGNDARRINRPMTPGGNVDRWERRGDVVLYVADGEVNEQLDVYTVGIRGESPQVVSSSLDGVRTARLTLDGSHAIVRPDDRTLVSIRVSDTSITVLATEVVEDFTTFRDDVMFLRGSITDSSYITVQEDGTDPRERKPSEFDPVILSPVELSVLDGDNVVALFTRSSVQGVDYSAWRFPLRGAGSTVRLSDPYETGSGLAPYQSAIVSGRLILRFATGELFSTAVAPADPTSTVELTPAFESSGSDFFTATPDGDVLFTSDTLAAGEQQLHVVPADGSVPARIITNAPEGVKLERGPASNTVSFTPDGDAIFVSRRLSGFDLAQVPLAGAPDDTIILTSGVNRPGFVMAGGSVVTSTNPQGIVEVVPGRIASVLARAGDAAVTASWAPPGDDGGKPITGYLVDLLDGSTVLDSQAVADTEAVFTDVANGRPLRVQVRALNVRADGQGQRSNQVVPVDPGVVRLDGPNRYATGAAVTATWFPDPVDVVYVATGRGFADALAGGPLAARTQAPVILVDTNMLPVESAAELVRLAPERVVILGGAVAVSTAVETAIGDLLDLTPERLAGASRYGTASDIALEFIDEGDLADDSITDVFIAFGRNFPDALAGSALAAARDNPILLTERDTLPTETRNAIDELKPTTITVLGGPAVVSAEVLTELEKLADNVVRLAGETRFETAKAIADEFDAPVTSAFLATGRNFPDALTGAAAAARGGNPLLLTERDQIPVPIAEALTRLTPNQIVILGGEVAVSKGVEAAAVAFLRAR